jgi:hypothetical protein
MLNHVHISSLFKDISKGEEILHQPLEDAITNYKPMFSYLSKVLAQCWRCALAQAFSDKQFSVQHDDDEADPTVTFYQIR